MYSERIDRLIVTLSICVFLNRYPMLSGDGLPIMATEYTQCFYLVVCQETSMAKLDEKFRKGSKSKFKSDFNDDFLDYNQQARKKKRRSTRQRQDSGEYIDFDYE